MNHLLGYKKGMTQVFADDAVVPVTIVEIPENVVCRVGKEDEDGLLTVDIGIGEKKHPTKAELGKYSDLKKVPMHVWSVMLPVSEDGEVKPGTTFGPELCSEGGTATVSGISKAKGFAGVVKRWGFKGGPRTHGQSDRQRAPGSIGGGTDPGRVFPGKKMPGRMGGEMKTLERRKVVKSGDGYILIKGSLPGNVDGLLNIEIENT